MTMLLLDFLVGAKVTGSKTLARMSVTASAVTLNGVPVTIKDLVTGVTVKAGDVVVFGKKTVTVTAEDLNKDVV